MLPAEQTPLIKSNVTFDTTGKDDIQDGQLEFEIRRWFRGSLQRKAGIHPYESCMDWFAGILIHEALDFTGGNRSRAAKLLGLSRPTLHAKIEKYRLRIETSVKKSTG